jgi:molybdenum cofactor guanylyltransferase
MIVASDIDGWITAGGASRRMGEDKAALEFGGRRLLELAADALSDVSEGRISVAGARREFASQWPAFPDMGAQGLGPLSGLVTALSNGSSEWIAVISCDMPFVTSKVFTILAHNALAKHAAVVPLQADDRPQPLCAIYRRQPVLGAARKLINGTDRSMSNLLTGLMTNYVPNSAFHVLPNAQHLFVNINTPADYERARNILQDSDF